MCDAAAFFDESAERLAAAAAALDLASSADLEEDGLDADLSLLDGLAALLAGAEDCEEEGASETPRREERDISEMMPLKSATGQRSIL